MKKEFFKNVIMFFIFGTLYCGIEILWRGHTNWTMAIVGGISGVLIGLLNEHAINDLSILQQCLIGMLLITVLEGCAGYILNIKLGLHIWDYSSMPGKFFWGQCCVPFCILWFFLAGVAIFLDDWLRWLLFDEKIPHYT